MLEITFSNSFLFCFWLETAFSIMPLVLDAYELLSLFCVYKAYDTEKIKKKKSWCVFCHCSHWKMAVLLLFWKCSPTRHKYVWLYLIPLFKINMITASNGFFFRPKWLQMSFPSCVDRAQNLTFDINERCSRCCVPTYISNGVVFRGSKLTFHHVWYLFICWYSKIYALLLLGRKLVPSWQLYATSFESVCFLILK